MYVQCELTCIGHNVTSGVIDVDHVHGERPLIFREKLPQGKGCHLHRHDAACQCVLCFAMTVLFVADCYRRLESNQKSDLQLQRPVSVVLSFPWLL